MRRRKIKEGPLNEVKLLYSGQVDLLKAEAEKCGHHFIHILCAVGMTKQQILQRIASAFQFPRHFGDNFDALYDCLTDLEEDGDLHGFIVVLEHLPNTSESDKEISATLLDVFKEATDFWAGRKVLFRVFYSYGFLH